MKRTLKLRAQGDLAKITIHATIEGSKLLSRDEMDQIRKDLGARLIQALPGLWYAGISLLDIKEVE